MVIPVHDINPLRRTPWVTYALIAANFVVLLLTPGMIPGSLPQATTVCRPAAGRWPTAHVFGFVAGLLVGLAVRAFGSGSRATA